LLARSCMTWSLFHTGCRCCNSRPAYTFRSRRSDNTCLLRTICRRCRQSPCTCRRYLCIPDTADTRNSRSSANLRSFRSCIGCCSCSYRCPSAYSFHHCSRHWLHTELSLTCTFRIHCRQG
jgi:hypothetical protein